MRIRQASSLSPISPHPGSNHPLQLLEQQAEYTQNDVIFLRAKISLCLVPQSETRVSRKLATDA
jgi:hypothetical protein